MSLVGHCAVRKMLFTISNKLDFGVMFFSAPAALLIVSTLGLLKMGLIAKNWRGRARQRWERERKWEKETLFFILTGFLNLASPCESGLIGMQTHLLLSSSLSYPVLPLVRPLFPLSLLHTHTHTRTSCWGTHAHTQTADYAYSTGRVC